MILASKLPQEPKDGHNEAQSGQIYFQNGTNEPPKAPKTIAQIVQWFWLATTTTTTTSATNIESHLGAMTYNLLPTTYYTTTITTTTY